MAYPDMELDAGAPEPVVLGDLDAPAAPGPLSKEERPFGSVDPSMYQSTRYRKFRDKVAAIRASLPKDKEKFATYEVPKLEDRLWLTRFCIKKEEGTLTGWQQLMLEKAGYTWVRGRRPKAPKKKRAPRVSLRETRWLQRCDALIAVCENEALPLVGLLRGEDAEVDWLWRQIAAFKEGRLSASQEAKLRALPFDFELLHGDPGFRRWRKAWRAYAADPEHASRRWGARQARLRDRGELAEWRIQALDAAGFDWEAFARRARKADDPRTKQERMEDRWRVKLEEYLAIQAEHGDAAPFTLTAHKSMIPWVSRMRRYYRRGELRPELVEEFKARGFEFDGRAIRRQEWEASYDKLCAFKERFGHAQVPASYGEDPALGKWFAIQQERMRKGELPPEKLKPLQALGVHARNAAVRRQVQRTHITPWLKKFNEILTIIEAEHDGRLPKVGRFSERHKSWMKRQAKKMKSGDLEPWQIEKLETICFDPDDLPQPPPTVDWGDRLDRLRRFIEEHGHTRVPSTYPDRALVAFVERTRWRKRRGKLNERELAVLHELGFSFTPNQEITPAWRRVYAELEDFYAKHGHSNVPRAHPENQPLAEFVAQQRQRGRKGLLLREHIRLLDAVNFRWAGGHPEPKDG